MPKLYVFVTCEKVISDSEGQTSLIALFNELTVFIPPESPLPPPNAVTPREWVIFSSWEKEPEDEGKEFVQHIQILYPDGTPFGREITSSFTPVAVKKYNQILGKANGFPVGQQGKYGVKMWLEHNGETVSGSAIIGMEVKYDRSSIP